MIDGEVGLKFRANEERKVDSPCPVFFNIRTPICEYMWLGVNPRTGCMIS